MKSITKLKFSDKVRNVYELLKPVILGSVRYHPDNILFLQSSNRLSVFDVFVKEDIERKGATLNVVSQYFEQFLKENELDMDIETTYVPVSQKDLEDAEKTLNSRGFTLGLGTDFGCITVVKKMNMIPIEMIVRANLIGSAWKNYQKGERTICGIKLPEGMKEGDAFPTPIVTPTTKAKAGHKMNVTKEQCYNIFSQWNSYIDETDPDVEEYRDGGDEMRVDELYRLALKIFEIVSKEYEEKLGYHVTDLNVEFGMDNGGGYCIGICEEVGL